MPYRDRFISFKSFAEDGFLKLVGVVFIYKYIIYYIYINFIFKYGKRIIFKNNLLWRSFGFPKPLNAKHKNYSKIFATFNLKSDAYF